MCFLKVSTWKHMGIHTKHRIHVYTYVCTYIHKHVHIHVHISTHLKTCPFTQIHTCTHTGTQTQTCMDALTPALTHKNHKQICTWTCRKAHTRKCTQAQMNTHAYLHTCTNIHQQTQACIYNYTHTIAHECTHVDTGTCVYRYMQMCDIYSCMHSQVCTLTYANTHPCTHLPIYTSYNCSQCAQTVSQGDSRFCHVHNRNHHKGREQSNQYAYKQSSLSKRQRTETLRR